MTIWKRIPIFSQGIPSSWISAWSHHGLGYSSYIQQLAFFIDSRLKEGSLLGVLLLLGTLKRHVEPSLEGNHIRYTDSFLQFKVIVKPSKSPQRKNFKTSFDLENNRFQPMMSCGNDVVTTYSDGLKLRTPFWNLHTAITERHRGQNLTAEDNFITHRFSY